MRYSVIPITAFTTDEHMKTPPTMSHTDRFCRAARVRKMMAVMKKGMAIIVNVFMSAFIWFSIEGPDYLYFQSLNTLIKSR